MNPADFHNTLSEPCPAGCDPVEWARMKLDTGMQAFNDEEEMLYTQAINAGAPGFHSPVREPCPVHCDPVEWDRMQADNERDAYIQHRSQTVEAWVCVNTEVEPVEDTWPMDSRAIDPRLFELEA